MLIPTSTLSPGQYLYFVLLLLIFFFTFFSSCLAATFCFPNIGHVIILRRDLSLLFLFISKRACGHGYVKMPP